MTEENILELFQDLKKMDKLIKNLVERVEILERQVSTVGKGHRGIGGH